MQRRTPPDLISRFGIVRLRIAFVLTCVILIAASLGLGQTALAAAGAGLGLAIVGYMIGTNTVRRQAADPAADVLHHEAHQVVAFEALQAVIGVLDQPAFALDAGSAVVACNRGARDLFPGLESGQWLHQVSRSPGLLEAVQHTRERGTAQSCEITGHALAGRRLLASVAPLESTAGNAGKAHMLVQFRDLSEQDRLTRLRTDFIANASHELRTPLASIKGFIETLQGPASADATARRKFLGIMEAQAARMTRILDDLLSLSRIEMREHLPPSDIFDVVSILRATVEGLEPIAREASITLEFVAAEGEAQVRGDRDELVQVFQNLIQNAIKYGHEGGRVDVTLVSHPAQSGQPPKIDIAVADDGPGIAEVHLPRLTERFYRVDTATSRERGGTGLGLAIVKHILNRHRGELNVASEPGKGSTFTVVLDAVPDAGSP